MKFIALFAFSLAGLTCLAQTDSTQPPFRRFPEIPAFKILLSDSTTWYKKEQIPEHKAVLVMLFSPECSHCQHETEELIAHKDAFKDIHIVMATFQPIWEMKEFVSKYKLNQMPNIIVGKDIYYTMPSFYNIHNLPYLAMYDKMGHLIDTFEGSMPIERVIEAFKAK